MPLTTYDPNVDTFAGRLPVTTGDFAASAFEQGVNDTLLGWSMRQMQNSGFGDDGRELSPQELKDTYNLNFDSPMREGRARLLAARKQAEEQRMMALQNGTTGMGRFALMMGAGMAGSIANPVDFAANVFVPFVGEASKIPPALRLARMSRLGRFATGGGIVTAEELARVGVPSGPVMASIFEGAMANAAIEIPLAYEKIVQEHSENYGIADSLLNVGIGAGFAGGLRAAGKALGRVMERLSPATHEAALREALNAAAVGRDIEVVRTINMSDEQIRAVVMERATQRAQAEASARAASIEAEVRAEFEAKRQAISDADVRRIVDDRMKSGFEQVAPELPKITSASTASDIGRQLELLSAQSDPPNIRLAERNLDKVNEIVAALEKKLADKPDAASTSLYERMGALKDSAEKRLADLQRAEIRGQKAAPLMRSEMESRIGQESSAAVERIKSEIESEKQRRIQQYFDEQLPKTPEERAKFVDRYAAERAAELDATARKVGVATDKSIKEAAATKPLDRVASEIDEDIKALTDALPEEVRTRIAAEEAATPAAKPDYDKGFKSVIDCIGKTL